MSKRQAIVFDLDDTLYPESEYVFSGFQAVSQWVQEYWNIDGDMSFHEMKRLFHEGVRGNIFNCWLAQHSLEQPETIALLVQVYRNHAPNINVFPEVPGLLTQLHERYQLGIVSDGWLTVQQHKVSALHISEWFDAIVLSDEWGREFWKPSSKPFEVVLDRLNVMAKQTVYVADNPSKDFLGARRVGMATVHLRQPNGEYVHEVPRSREYAADIIVETLGELENTLAYLLEKQPPAK